MVAPKKYVKINGVMKLNPEYKRWQESQTGVGTATSVKNSDQALPVVTSMEDHTRLNQDLGIEVPLSESTNATIEMMQEPEICLEAGMQPDEMVDQLGSVLAKYEVPMGLMNKVIMTKTTHTMPRPAKDTHPFLDFFSLSTTSQPLILQIAHDALRISIPRVYY
jgi:hypothetical protein